MAIVPMFLVFLSSDKYAEYFLIATIGALVSPIILSIAPSIVLYQEYNTINLYSYLIKNIVLTACFVSFIAFPCSKVLRIPPEQLLLGLLFGFCQAKNNITEKIFRKNKKVGQYLMVVNLPTIFSVLLGGSSLILLNMGYEPRFISFIIITIFICITLEKDIFRALIKKKSRAGKTQKKIKKAFITGIPFVVLLVCYTQAEKLTVKALLFNSDFEFLAPNYIFSTIAFGVITVIDRTIITNMWLDQNLNKTKFCRKALMIFGVTCIALTLLSNLTFSIKITNKFSPLFSSLIIIDAFIFTCGSTFFIYLHKISRGSHSLFILSFMLISFTIASLVFGKTIIDILTIKCVVTTLGSILGYICLTRE